MSRALPAKRNPSAWIAPASINACSSTSVATPPSSRWKNGVRANARSSKRASTLDRSASKPWRPNVLRRPLVAECLERRRRLALPGRRERAALVVEPVERLLVREIPAVLVEDERAAGAQECDDPVERRPKVADVVE